MEYIVVIIIFAVIFFAGKMIILKSTEASLVKDDQLMKNKSDKLKTELNRLNKQLETAYRDNMTPEEIENFWKNKK